MGRSRPVVTKAGVSRYLGPRPTAGDSWQQELVLDVSTQVPQQDNNCGLIVLQFHLILGFFGKNLALSYQNKEKTQVQ